MSALEPALGPGLVPGWTLQAESVRPQRALDSKPVKSTDRVGGPRRGLVEDEELPEPSSPGWRLSRLLLEAFIILVAAVVISTLIRTFGFEQFRVPTGSMEQTLYGQRQENGKSLPGDRIFVSKLGDFQRGDVVVFEDQLGWLMESAVEPSLLQKPLEFIGLLPDSSKRYLVKRLIGLPGDRVTCCNANGKIEVNGYELNETYLYQNLDGNLVAPSAQTFDLVVPADRVFVLGDNRNNSADSRYHLCSGPQRTPELAFPHVNDIVGPVAAIVYPFSRMRLFHTPDEFADVPPQSSQGPPQAEVSVYPSC